MTSKPPVGAAARIVCDHPHTEGYTALTASLEDARHKVALIEEPADDGGGCEGPHRIEVWQDGSWIPADLAQTDTSAGGDDD